MIQRLVQLAVDEGGEVRDSLVGGEGLGQHGGVGDPLVGPSEVPRDPGVGRQQLPGGLFVGVPEVFLPQSAQLGLAGVSLSSQSLGVCLHRTGGRAGGIVAIGAVAITAAAEHRAGSVGGLSTRSL